MDEAGKSRAGGADWRAGLGAAWLVGLTAYSLWLWGAAFGTRWTVWAAAAAGAAIRTPMVLYREPALLLGPATLIAAWLLGRALLRRLLPEPPTAALSLAAGLVALALTGLVLGSIGLYRPTALIAILAAAAGAGLADRLRSREQPRPVPPLSRLEWLLLAPMLAIAVITALSPSLYFDALAYHFSLPRLYLRLGVTVPVLWQPFSFFPSNAEMLFGYGLAGGSELGPQSLLVGVWLAAVLLVRDCAARLAGPAAALPALLVALSAAGFLLTALLGTNDPVGLLFALAGLYCLLAAAEAARANDLGGFWRWAAAWAMMAGGAGGTKYTLWVSGLALPFALLLWSARSLGRRGLRAAVAAGAGAGLLVLPWTLRSLLASGNPIMPVTVAGLPGLPADAWRQLVLDSHTVGWTAAAIPRNLLFPWLMTFDSWDNLAREWGSGFYLGPALWMGALLAVSRRAGHGLVWAYALLALAAAGLVQHMTRFAYPGLGALGVIAGVGLASWLAAAPRLPRAAGRVALAVVYVLALALVARGTANHTAGYRYPRRAADLDAYLTDRGSSPTWPGEHLLQRRAALMLPQSARVLLVGDGTFFLIDREVEAASFLSRNRLLDLFGQGLSDEAVAAELRAAGFSHVLVSYRELERLQRTRGLLGYTPALDTRLRAFSRGPSCRLVDEDRKTGGQLCELAR